MEKKTFGDLKIGDKVYMVNSYGYFVTQGVYVLVEKKEDSTVIVKKIESDLNSYNEMFIGSLRQFKVSDPSKSVVKTYRTKIFSDYEVAKHSISCHLKQRERKIKGQIRVLKKKLNRLDNSRKQWSI